MRAAGIGIGFYYSMTNNYYVRNRAWLSSAAITLTMAMVTNSCTTSEGATLTVTNRPTFNH
jgi:hypothetical protein